MKCQRSYKLKLLGNKSKTDTALYAHSRFCLYLEMFMGKYFFGTRHISTRGMGDLAGRALYKAIHMVRALNALHRKTGVKINVPYKPNVGCRAKLEKSKNSFNYWVSVPNLWRKIGVVKIPAKSHKALNHALKSGWKLSSLCEIKPINGVLYAHVFVSKEVTAPLKPNKFIGCDAGIRQSVSISDGYIGRGLSKIMRVQKQRHAERHRQKHERLTCQTET